MADDCSGQGVDDLFGDIGAMVGHSFALVGDLMEREGEIDGHCAAGDLLFGIAEDFGLECFDGVFAFEDELGELGIRAIH